MGDTVVKLLMKGVIEFLAWFGNEIFGDIMSLVIICRILRIDDRVVAI